MIDGAADCAICSASCLQVLSLFGRWSGVVVENNVLVGSQQIHLGALCMSANPDSPHVPLCLYLCLVAFSTAPQSRRGAVVRFGEP